MRLPEDWRSRACLVLVLVWGLAALCEALTLFPADADHTTEGNNEAPSLVTQRNNTPPSGDGDGTASAGISIEVTPWTAF